MDSIKFVLPKDEVEKIRKESNRDIGGNYITGAEQKARLNKWKKEIKAIKKQQKVDEEKERLLNFSKYITEKKEQREAEQQEKLFFAQCKQFVSYAAENIPIYKEYLIAYDIACQNFYQIENDLLRGKITKEQVKKVWLMALKFIDDIAEKYYINGLLN